VQIMSLQSVCKTESGFANKTEKLGELESNVSFVLAMTWQILLTSFDFSGLY
jgi:hypothetical protein